MTKFEERIEEIKNFYQILLSFLDNDEQQEENYQKICQIITGHNFIQNNKELKPFIKLIQKLVRNHHRSSNFFDNIFKILEIILKDIKQIYSNLEIFQLFKNDKRILLFLIESGILTIDEQISCNMCKGKYKYDNYPQYFNLNPSNGNTEEQFIKNRQIGENDEYICQLIRNDSIEEFIIYINKTNLPIQTYTIQPSIFETNSYLLKHNPTLLEYSTFCGSIQIFQYLMKKDIKLTPSLWEYAIHSNNSEIIYLLEEQNFDTKLNNKFYLKIFREAIKCHHNEIAYYIQENHFNENNKNNNKNIILYSLQFYNYEFYPKNFNYEGNLFLYACKYGHFYIIEKLMKKNKINLNKTFTIPYKYKRCEKEEYIVNPILNNENFDLSEDWTGRSNYISNNTRSTNRFTQNIYEEVVTAFHVAVEKEEIDVLELLLNKGQINIENLIIRRCQKSNYKESKSILHVAIETSNLNIIKMLCEKTNKEIVNTKSIIEYSYSDSYFTENILPIHVAIKNEEVEIIKYLVNNLSDNILINYKYKYINKYYDGSYDGYEEKTPLVLAAEKGNFEIFEILLSHQKIDVNMMSIIFDEAQNNSYRFIVKCAPLHIAIKTQNYKIIKLLLNNKDTNINALYEKCFIFYKVQKSKQYKTPLCIAIENKDDEMIKILLDSKRIEIKDALVNIGNKSRKSGCLHTFSLKIKQKPDILPMSYKQRFIEKNEKKKKLPFFLFEYISAKEAYHKINANSEYDKFDKEFNDLPNNSFFDTDVNIEDDDDNNLSAEEEEEEEYYY